MKLKIPKNFGPTKDFLEALDNIRFEEPSLNNSKTKIILESGPEDHFSTEGNNINVGLKDKEKLGEVIPHIFSASVITNLKNKNKILANIRDNMLPEATPYIHENYVKDSPEEGLLKTYLANRLHAWLGVTGKQTISFKDYLKKYPPDKHILGVLHNALLQL